MLGGAPAATVFSSFSNCARVIWVLQSGWDAGAAALADAFPAAAGRGAGLGAPLSETSQTPLMVITGESAGTDESGAVDDAAGGAAWAAPVLGGAGFADGCSLCAAPITEPFETARRKKMNSLERINKYLQKIKRGKHSMLAHEGRMFRFYFGQSRKMMTEI